MSEKESSPQQTIANDETTCLVVEQERNGEPIDWNYWATRLDILPLQAAKLVHLIDPIKWRDDNTFAQGALPEDLSAKIQSLSERLEKRKQSWMLSELKDELGGLSTPYRIRQVILQAHRALLARDEKKKHEAGRYTLKEAAESISTATAERSDVILQKLMNAAGKGYLAVFDQGENARREYGPRSVVMEFHEEAFWDDLNTWLQEFEPRIN